jgi:hypothetical protein
MSDPLGLNGKLVRLRASGTGIDVAAAAEDASGSGKGVSNTSYYVGILPRSMKPFKKRNNFHYSAEEEENSRFFGAVHVERAHCFQLLYVPGKDYVLRSLTELKKESSAKLAEVKRNGYRYGCSTDTDVCTGTLYTPPPTRVLMLLLLLFFSPLPPLLLHTLLSIRNVI